MRTTISLPDDLHHQLASIARDRRVTLSRTIEELVRRAMHHPDDDDRLQRSPVTGLLTVRLDRPITADDVRALEDEE